MMRSVYYRAAVLAILLVFLPAISQGESGPSSIDCLAKQSGSPMRFVFLIDVTKSMAGYKGTKSQGAVNVFPKLKRILTHEYADAIPPGSEVWVVPFGAGVIKERVRKFRFPEERASYEEYVYSLKANQWNTYIYRSLVEVLRDLRATGARVGSLPTAIYLFTDGMDVEEKREQFKHFGEVLNYVIVYDRCRLRDVRLILLNDNSNTIKVLKRIEEQSRGRVRVISATGEKGEVVVPYVRSVYFKPAALNLGNLWKTSSVTRTISATLDIGNTPALVQLSVEDRELSAQGAYLSVEPGEIKVEPGGVRQFRLRFSLHNVESLEQGRYTAALHLRPVRVSSNYVEVVPSTIKLSLEYLEPLALVVEPANALSKKNKIVFDEKNREAELSYLVRIKGKHSEVFKLELHVEHAPEALDVRVNGHSTNSAYIELPPGKSTRVDLKFLLKDHYSAQTGTPSLVVRSIEPAGLSASLALPSLSVLPPPVPLTKAVAPVLLFFVVALLALGFYILFRRRALGANCGVIEICDEEGNCDRHELGTYEELKRGITLEDFHSGIGDIVIRATRFRPCELEISDVPEKVRVVGAEPGDILEYGHGYSVAYRDRSFSFAVFELDQLQPEEVSGIEVADGEEGRADHV